MLCMLLGLEPGAPGASFAGCQVEDMNDGGMGGIRFVSSNPQRQLGGTLAEAEYEDADGIKVSITLNADQYGDLYEIDFWKVDFSPLRLYPRPEQLRVTARC